MALLSASCARARIRSRSSGAQAPRIALGEPLVVELDGRFKTDWRRRRTTRRAGRPEDVGRCAETTALITRAVLGEVDGFGSALGFAAAGLLNRAAAGLMRAPFGAITGGCL